MLKTAIMKILRKGEKCPLEPGNYRPISLLSVFYKIWSGLGWPRIPQVSNLQQLPISCGSIHLLDDKTLKDYILSSKISPAQAMSFLAQPPLGWKKNILEYRVYCIQNDRLGHTVPTKQTVNWSEFRGPRYQPKRAWISLTKPNHQISARFGWYLGPLNSDQFTVCFVGTVWPSRSFWIQ